MVSGQDLLTAGYIGQRGTALLAEKKEERLLEWFSEAYIRQIQRYEYPKLSDNPKFWRDLGVTEWEAVGEGGILAALWNLSGLYEAGIEIHLRRIPVKQHTIEICERFDLNPYRLWSDNCMLLVGNNGGQIAEALGQMGITASVIGKVNHGIKREVYNDGVHGFLERPKKDELKKLIEIEKAVQKRGKCEKKI